MRRAVVLAITLILLAATPVYGVDTWQAGEGGIGFSDHQPGDASADPGAGGGAAGGTPARLYSYWTIGWAGDRFCRVRHVTADPDLAAAYTFALHYDFAAGNASGTSAECPATSAANPPQGPPPPDLLARDFWDVRLLPKPTLAMSPDYAVAGKRVYLQIGGERSKHFDVPDPLGLPIAIEATSHYVVDWGDGTLESTTSTGGPWPDGDVTHVYTTARPAMTIRVAQEWSATWQAGDQQGGLDGLHTDGSMTFRVTEVQAVRE
jgi:hypothetical protein